MGFSKEELQAQYGRTVPDLVGPGCRLLFVGINPGLWTAATQTHFAYPGNRFYPALHRADITPRPIDPAAGMSDDDRIMFIDLGLGITNIVRRATARADELAKEEFVDGGARLTGFVEEWGPKVVAIAGLGAYRTAFGRPNAKKGMQDDRIGNAEVWLTGNPSGLNAHETVDTLAEQFRTIAERAGVV
ncbi:MAG: mismatch-specific DNA-glycosylase [Acidimicrobiia bacterium]|jgi:TDG/mug DNA glycosylase family protein|nr:MAG: mismatch-specific DNA-glycosylase [Acidimicrobiia bacterium]